MKYNYILSHQAVRFFFVFLSLLSPRFMLLLPLLLVGTCFGLLITPSDYYHSFGMSLKLFEENGRNILCLASIDSRIAHFDNPIEWLQMSLKQQPCAESRWVAVIAYPSTLDPSVIDILKNYASVDLIASDVDPNISSVSHVLPNVTLDISQQSITDTSTGRIIRGESSLTGNRKIFTKPISKTSSSNIVWAIALSCLAGLIVNISARATGLPKRTLYSNVPS